jgi:hypothetical protein
VGDSKQHHIIVECECQIDIGVDHHKNETTIYHVFLPVILLSLANRIQLSNNDRNWSSFNRSLPPAATPAADDAVVLPAPTFVAFFAFGNATPARPPFFSSDTNGTRFDSLSNPIQ